MCLTKGLHPPPDETYPNLFPNHLCCRRSRWEFWRYNRVQIKIVQQLKSEDKEEHEDDKAAPTAGCRRFFLFRGLANFVTNIKEKHSWVSLFWPVTARVYPTRVIKVLVVMATTSLGLGCNAIFAFTAIQQELKGVDIDTVNTLMIHINGGSYAIPMDGIYTFAMILPALFTMSWMMGKYVLNSG